MNLAVLTPEQFQSAVLGWIAALATIVPAVFGIVLLVWSKISELRKQIDGQQQRIDTHSDRIHDLALSSPSLVVEAPKPADEGPRLTPLGIVVALLLPALALSGCGTPFGKSVATVIDSPAAKAVVNIGIKVGVDSLFASYGDNIPEELRAPLEAAAVSAATSLTSGAGYAAAQALRTKQGTKQDVSTSALASAVTQQADVPPAVVLPIAQAVAALNNQGVPADAANEAVAKTLDAVAAAKSPSGSGKTVVPFQSTRRTSLRPLPVLYSATDAPVYPVVKTSLP